MKSFSGFVFGVAVGLTATVAMAAGPVLLAPSDMHWTAGTGPNKGTTGTILLGNPAKSDLAIVRVKMPDGYVNAPHYHAHPEYVTVLSGTVLFGTGDTIDKSKATVLPAGSFIMVPAGVHHWSVSKGETVVQVGGEGPLTNIPVKRSGM